MSGPLIDENFGGPGSDEEKVLDHLEACFAGDIRRANQLLNELCSSQGGRWALSSFAAAIVEVAADEHGATPQALLAVLRAGAVGGKPPFGDDIKLTGPAK